MTGNPGRRNNMSKTVFKPVLSQADSSDNSRGKLNIVRPSALASEGFTGTVVEGIYEGSVPNKFDENKKDYKIRAENGDLTIINETGSLRYQMEKVTVGSLVQINYNGKTKIESGKLAGKGVHNFEVMIA